MASSGLCLFASHVWLCSQIAGEPRSVPECPDPAAYTTVVEIRPAAGLTLRIDVEVCDRHNAKFATASGYNRSIKLRDRTTT